MKKITDVVWELAEPAVQAQGCRIWDVEYVREAGQWYLRLYLDKDGGMDILDCEAMRMVRCCWIWAARRCALRRTRRRWCACG